MPTGNFQSRLLSGTRCAVACIAITQLSLSQPMMSYAEAENHSRGHHAISPIKHVIVIVGENRSFDHLFATYKPARHDETVDNLLSKHIIKADGAPGRDFWRSHQFSADATDSSTYQLAPKNKTLYSPMPAPLNGGPIDVCKNNGICTLADATSSEDGLAEEYYPFLLTGGSELTGKVPDSRISGVSATAPYSTLPPGPFQLTNSLNADTFPYDSYAASPVHRFYQMFQQLDCDASNVSKETPDGCLKDLFAWTEVTQGAGQNGLAQPSTFSTDYAPGMITTGEGSTSMGFYNMLQGDAPYTKFLADHYAMSDNYHQPAKGGTGLDSIMLFFADAIWFNDPTALLRSSLRTTWRSLPISRPMRALWMRSRIPIRRREPTTGGRRTVTAAVVSARRFTAAEATPTARILRSPACSPS